MEIARLFFAWLALFFDFPTILEPGTGHKKSDEIKELWGFTIKKTKFIPCFVHASEVYFIFYVLQVNFFCVSDVSFQAVSGTVNLIFISNKDDTP